MVRLGDPNAIWPADGRPEHLRAACHASLERLRLERIDLYQLHTVDPAVPIEESVGALAELQAEGKIRHIGVSNVDADDLARARSAAPIAAVQNRYSIAYRLSDDVLAICERDGLAFLPWQPLFLGRHGETVARLLPAHGATGRQIALAWLLARSPAVVAIPGTRSLAHLEENLAARALRLTEEERTALEREIPPYDPARDPAASAPEPIGAFLGNGMNTCASATLVSRGEAPEDPRVPRPRRRLSRSSPQSPPRVAPRRAAIRAGGACTSSPPTESSPQLHPARKASLSAASRPCTATRRFRPRAGTGRPSSSRSRTPRRSRRSTASTQGGRSRPAGGRPAGTGSASPTDGRKRIRTGRRRRSRSCRRARFSRRRDVAIDSPARRRPSRREPRAERPPPVRACSPPSRRGAYARSGRLSRVSAASHRGESTTTGRE